MLPHILPKLVHLPLSYAYMLSSSNSFSVPCGSAVLTKISVHTYSAFNAHALGALAEVAGPGLGSHLSTILPALLNAMGYTDMVCLLTDMCIHFCYFHFHFVIFNGLIYRKFKV